MFIEPGAPWQEPCSETFHARYRDQRLDHELFQSLTEARVLLEQRRRRFIEERPHGALGDNVSIEARNPFTASGSLTLESTP